MDRPLTSEQRHALNVTGVFLFLANLFPVIAVWKLDWKLPDLLTLYWGELILIGLIHLVKTILFAPAGSGPGFHLLKLFYVPFLAGLFGCFTFGVAFAAQYFFGRENFQAHEQLRAMMTGDQSLVLWPLIIAHALSFCRLFLMEKEFRNPSITRRMTAPYLRVLPFCLLAIGGGLCLRHLGNERWILTAVAGGKALVDWSVHLLLHRGFLRGFPVEPE